MFRPRLTPLQRTDRCSTSRLQKSLPKGERIAGKTRCQFPRFRKRRELRKPRTRPAEFGKCRERPMPAISDPRPRRRFCFTSIACRGRGLMVAIAGLARRSDARCRAVAHIPRVAAPDRGRTRHRDAAPGLTATRATAARFAAPRLAARRFAAWCARRLTAGRLTAGGFAAAVTSLAAEQRIEQAGSHPRKTGFARIAAAAADSAAAAVSDPVAATIARFATGRIVAIGAPVAASAAPIRTAHCAAAGLQRAKYE